MRKTSRLSESSRQVIALMRQQGPLTLAQLRPLIGIADGEITKRLRNLCVSGWLEKIEGPELRWGICSAAAPLFDTGKAPRKPQRKEQKPKPELGEFPLPRQIDVMNSTYEPEPFTPPRAGSTASQSIASRGLRC